ncbi:Rieske (2Fe-2S) protein [Spongiibacter sp.]|uniref:Rieske (2Fe-2S) protein n=1 Tax=Spongiibacter sp. TaxID=2024860 RepID=UPI0035669FA1
MEPRFIASLEEVKDGEFLKREVDGQKLLLTRVNGQIAAVENRCPHLGLPLARGKICDGAVTCPFHGSSFDLLSGDNIDWAHAILGAELPRWSHKLLAMGRAPQALKTFDIECIDGAVYLRS